MAKFRFWSGPAPTTAVLPPIATGVATLKTMLQVKPASTIALKVVEWGISLDGYAAAQPGSVELIETDVAATVTAYVAADIVKVDAGALLFGDPTTSLFTVGTSSSGYGPASAEGSITATRLLDGLLIPPTGPLIKQIVLGKELAVQAGKFLRIRTKFAASVNLLCYVDLEL